MPATIRETVAASRRLQIACWILAGVTGMGVAGFERSRIAFAMKSAYAIMAVWLPLAITGISIVGLGLTMGLRSKADPVAARPSPPVEG